MRSGSRNAEKTRQSAQQFHVTHKSACLGPRRASPGTQQPSKRTQLTMPQDDTPFWKRKRLTEMSDAEWESLCDRCGRCCLVKLEDEDTDHIYFTDVGCRLLDVGNCRCRD